MLNRQRGSVIVGIIIGVVIGLAAALAVAVYVTKVPIPFLNKGLNRTADQDAAEVRKNQNWDPNAPLYGKNPAKALPPAPLATPATSGTASPLPPAVAGNPIPASPPSPAASSAGAGSTGGGAGGAGVKSATKPPVSSDPLGDLAMARSATPGADPFLYFVQAGAFRTSEDAEAQRAKLSLMGLEAKVTEREQAGRQVFRVRVGPFDKKDEADRNKEKLESGGVETALVRVQR